MNVSSRTSAFWADESGASAIEYALMGALIAVAIIVAVTAMGTNLGVVYTTWSNAVVGAL